MVNPFNLYGVFIGLGLVVSMWLIQKQASNLKIQPQELDRVFIWAVLGGVIGARAWHVATDFQLYQNTLVDALKVWQGGLSILGAVVGGALAVALYLRLTHSLVSLRQLLDLAVFGLPFGQVIGRLGNYVNQELYGLPTQLPWAIFIEPAARLPGYEAFETFHPLFAYEMSAMLLFGVWVWWRARDVKQIGSGRWFGLYVLYYSVVRFLLDFLRPDKAVVNETGLGINQVVLLGLAIGAGFFLLQRKARTDA